jgi:hypothetical protein
MNGKTEAVVLEHDLQLEKAIENVYVRTGPTVVLKLIHRL